MENMNTLFSPLKFNSEFEIMNRLALPPMTNTKVMLMQLLVKSLFNHLV